MKLTGKAIHEIVQALDESAEPHIYEEFEEETRDMIEAMAAKINEQFITPLQGVIRDYQQFVDSGHYIRTLVYAPKDAQQLRERAQALLGEEPLQ